MGVRVHPQGVFKSPTETTPEGLLTIERQVS